MYFSSEMAEIFQLKNSMSYMYVSTAKVKGGTEEVQVQFSLPCQIFTIIQYRQWIENNSSPTII